MSARTEETFQMRGETSWGTSSKLLVQHLDKEEKRNDKKWYTYGEEFSL